MENQKDIAEYVKKITDPIFNGVLHETNNNQMSVGHHKDKSKRYCIYNLHNYRLYIDFNKTNLNTKKLRKLPNTDLKNTVDTTYRLKNITEHEVNNFMGCRITIKKTQAEVQNKIGIKKKYLIEITTDANKRLKEITTIKDNESILVLKEFIRQYGGYSGFKILNRHSENKLSGEDSIDKIPLKMKWHGDISKKVYNEKNVEFPDVSFASNYIESRAIESQAKPIFNRLGGIETSLSKLNPILTEVNKSIQLEIKNKKLHQKVLNSMDKTLKDIRNNLNQKRLTDF